MSDFVTHVLAHSPVVGFVDSLRAALPAGRVVVWCNQPMSRSMFPQEWDVIQSHVNVPKYPVMRQMFRRPMRESHILWLDDDVIFRKVDLAERFASTNGAAYSGLPRTNGHSPDFWAYCQRQPWFRGRSPETKNGKPITRWAPGGMFWLRKDIIDALDWPPAKYQWLGGSQALLGAAVWQMGEVFTPVDFRGIFIQQSKQRTPKEKWPWARRRSRQDVLREIDGMGRERRDELLNELLADSLRRRPEFVDGSA